MSTSLSLFLLSLILSAPFIVQSKRSLQSPDRSEEQSPGCILQCYAFSHCLNLVVKGEREGGCSFPKKCSCFTRDDDVTVKDDDLWHDNMMWYDDDDKTPWLLFSDDDDLQQASHVPTGRVHRKHPNLRFVGGSEQVAPPFNNHAFHHDDDMWHDNMMWFDDDQFRPVYRNVALGRDDDMFILSHLFHNRCSLVCMRQSYAAQSAAAHGVHNTHCKC